MHNQQLIFSLVFIFLGSVLGWFSHSAYLSYNHQPVISTNSQVEPEKKHNVAVKPLANLVIKKETETKTEKESIKPNFDQLLQQRQYDRALSYFKNSEQKELLHSKLLDYLNELVKEVRWSELTQVTDEFLAEFYNDVMLLKYKSRAMSETGQYVEAINTLYLAKNYAINELELKQIELLIYELSQSIYKKYSDNKRWDEAIQFFELFVENEPDYSAFHMSLAELYIKINNYEQAIMHLQLLTSDAEYGAAASKTLQSLFSSDSQKGIKLLKHNSHYFVTASISGIYQVNLMLDTGASLTILSPDLIEQLVQDGQAAHKGTNKLLTAAGSINADIYLINNMSIGQFSVNNVKTAELKLEQVGANSQPIDGLLGMSFLNQFNFTIDQDNQRILLSPK